jgi:hypothetical protein
LIRTANTQPDAKAVDVLTPIYARAGAKNPRAEALQAIVGNGGSADMTAGQFVDHVRGQYAAAGGGPLAPGSTAAQNAGTTDPMVLDAAKSVQRMPPNMNAGQLEDAFWQSAIEGKPPNFGTRGGALGRMTDAAFRDYKVARMQQLGLSEADLHNTAATYKALNANLTKQTANSSAIEASVQTLENNIKIAQGLLDKGGSPTVSPVLNKWIQGGRKKIAGDPDVIALDGTLRLISSEAAAMMTRTTGTGGSGTSDAARREAAEILSGNYSKTALQGMFGVIQREGEGRVQSYRDQVSSTRDAISRLAPHVTATSPASASGQGGSPQHTPYTDVQLQAAAPYHGSSAPQGSEGNPMLAASPAAGRALIDRYKPTQQNPLFILDTLGRKHRIPALPTSTNGA